MSAIDSWIQKAFVVTVFLGCMVESMVKGEHTHCIARVTKIYKSCMQSTRLFLVAV